MRLSGLMAAVTLSGILSACSSIVEGTSQTISVNTTPPGADCKIHRNGAVIAQASPTPAGVTIQKTKHNLNVICEKPGYQKTEYAVKSDVAGATVGNIILGGGIGWAIDSASGADNKYQDVLNIALAPAEGGAPAAANATATAGPAQASNTEDRLAQIKTLLDRGLMTPAEYEQKRKEIVSGI